MDLHSKFTLRQLVAIDGDGSLKGFITGVQFRSIREPLYEVSFMHNGDQKTPWIEEFRLEDAS